LNYRGVRLSATFQNWTAFGTILLVAVFVAFGTAKGSARNFPPLFTHSAFVSILLVLQIVPYFMTGFESVSKAAEEASADFKSAGFSKAILMALLVGILFYTTIIAAVGYAAPWRQLTSEKFMTAVAFEHAVGSRWIVSIVLTAALLSLFKVFNGNFVAASRLLFAMGRRGLIAENIGQVHPTNQTPSSAVLCVGLATAACMFLGDAILVPITEVGSLASAIGWFAACAAYFRMQQTGSQRLMASIGGIVSLTMIAMKIVPGIPGHFSMYEWLALAIWITLGAALGWHGLIRRQA
jgi:amino acid transporter